MLIESISPTTPTGEPHGYIRFLSLKQLWFNTGTACNLQCPSCFEGSNPRSRRLQMLSVEDITPYIESALSLGVESFGFTGGEPFMNPHIMKILEFAGSKAPCLILTNGTKPITHYLPQLKALQEKGLPLTFRISLNSPNETINDAERGDGSFNLALQNLKKLHNLGFPIAVARHMESDEDSEDVLAQFRALFHQHGIPESTTIVGFPDLERDEVPYITENCIKTYHTPESCVEFMCATSRMVVKKEGETRIFSCTLVDDDPFYDLGSDLAKAVQKKTWLTHKRCFACFSSGVSCGQV